MFDSSLFGRISICCEGVWNFLLVEKEEVGNLFCCFDAIFLDGFLIDVAAEKDSVCTMGCGTSRDSSNYHGVAARFGTVLNTSSSSNMFSTATSETSSDASNDSGFEDEVQQPQIQSGRKRRVRERKRKKRKQDQMLNFGDFRVKMVDELGKEDMKYPHPSAVERVEGPCVIKHYRLSTCGGHASRVKMTLVASTEKLILSCSNEDATV